LDKYGIALYWGLWGNVYKSIYFTQIQLLLCLRIVLQRKVCVVEPCTSVYTGDISRLKLVSIYVY
jgi:hypothetical protein